MIALLASWLITKRPGLTVAYARRLVKIGLGVTAFVILAVAFTVWLNAREKAAVAADRARANVEALERAREADERAEAASTAKTDEVERENEEARKAAEESSDPLAAALDKLREMK